MHAEPPMPEPAEIRDGDVEGIQDWVERGLALIQAGRIEESIEVMEEGLALDPRSVDLHRNLGVALARLERLEDALRHFRQAATIEPAVVDHHRNLAVALGQQGRLEESEAEFAKIVELEPGNPRAHYDLGHMRRLLKRPSEAAADFEEALRLKPDFPEARHDLGLALSQLDRKAEAKECYEEALRLKPDFCEAYNNLGVLLEESGELTEAEQCFRKGLTVKPGSDETHNNLGVVLAAMGRHGEAAACYRHALALNPRSAHAYNNLGNALRTIGEVDEAIECLNQAIRLRPDYAEAYNNVAIALVQKGRIDAALENYERALYHKPDYAEAHMNRALALLGEGDYERGWTEYEWRWKGKEMRHPAASVHRRRWVGSPLRGRTILLKAEQGLGDTIQFARYASLLKQRGATVILESQKSLARLLASCPGIDRIVVRGSEEQVEFDFYAPLMSLPGIFKSTLETIPAEVPYLVPEEERLERWRARVSAIPGYKVGIAWQGNPDYRGDRMRSIPLRRFAPLGAIDGVTLVSLQKGFGVEQLEEIAGEFHVETLGDVDTDGGAFLDTAAILSHLDLVITSDTALPHVAGALGVPVWMATPLAADWRWLRRGSRCPWYPTMRMFRQRSQGDWQAVFREIAEALVSRMREGREAVKPASPALDRQAEARTLHSRAIDLIGQENLAEATGLLEQARRADPESAPILHDLGIVSARQGALDGAIAYLEEALRLRPDYLDALSNVGLAFLQKGDLESAERHLRRALEVGPASAETHNNLGVTLIRKGCPREAATCYQQALQIRPDYPEAHLNLARALLIQGDFEQGWLEYEWRARCAGYRRPTTPKPRWGGEPLGSKRLLLHTEQGLGDTLQLIRYVPLVKRDGGTVIVECQSSLIPLLRSFDGIDVLSAAGGRLPDHDVVAPLLSLPGLFRTTLATIPASVPYLKADHELVTRWCARLQSVDGLRVGIAWQGNPDYDGDKERSVPLVHFAALARIPGVSLVSLQKGPGTGQLATMRDRLRVIDFGPELDEQSGAFMDSAAILENLDLVITSDTALAHLAGAMGRLVWVALPFAPDARWLEHREDSPWYPTMRLYRQKTRGEWNEVFQRMAGGLRAMAAVRTDRTSVPSDLRQSTGESPKHHTDGVRFMSAGNLGMAVTSFQRAIGANPHFAAARHDLGVALARQGRFEQAIAAFREALQLDPHGTGVRENLALAYLDTNRGVDAERVIREALELGHESPGLLNHMGIALASQGRHAEAIPYYERAIESRPDFAEAFNNLGNARRLAGDPGSAIADYRRAIEIRAEYAEPFNNLGITLSQLGNLEQAVECYQEAVRLRPDYSEAFNNLGVSLADLDRTDEAVATFRKSLYLRPDNADTHKNLGLVLLLRGEYEAGWLEYEWRFRSIAASRRHFPVPRWDGAPLDGRRILLHAEQGLGDTLQFVRYAKLVCQRGGRVVLECQKPLVRILKGLLEVEEIVASGDQWPTVDLHAPLMSLAGIFGTTLPRIPNEVPYLAPDPRLEAQWGNVLSSVPGFKVGIAWQGSRTYPGDRNRSPSLREFAPVAMVQGVQLISLQKGDGSEQLRQADLGFDVLAFEDVDEESGAFMDTAAILRHLDLVITSDTALPHLAGALGVPVWTALCCSCDWRWMRRRDDSPWYPTMRLFRQVRPGDWLGTFQRIAEEVKNHV